MAERTKKTEPNTVTSISLDIEALLMPLALIISTIIFSVSFIIGMGRVEIGSVSTVKGTTTAGSGDNDSGDDVVARAEAPATTGVVSIDDDPIKGDRDAEVFIVEFSDYECPFCQSFYNDTLPSIQEEYIESGQVAFVYRDLPLSFHPFAQPQAEAAECIREQSNDETYFEAHDEIFERGGQLSDDDLVELGEDLGVDGDELRDCLENGDKTEEVNNDAADASAAGINGTPGFVVGTIDEDGVVTGEVISGAQPFSVFQNVIESYLE